MTTLYHRSARQWKAGVTKHDKCQTGNTHHGAHGSRNIVLGEGERASIIAAEAGRAAGDQHGRHLEATHAAWAGKTTDEVLLLCAADALGWFTSDTAVLGNTTEALTATLAQNLHVVHIARAVAANASVAHAWRHGSGR